MLKHIPFYASLLGRELADGTKTTTSYVLVYGAVEAHAIGERGCIASNATIAEETGLTRNSVATIISRLSKTGWLEIKLNKNNQRLSISPLMDINPPLTPIKPPFDVHQTENTVREDSKEDTTNVVSASERKASPPYELVQHVIAIQGIKPFPSMPMQLAAAKRILGSGYTLEEAKVAGERMQADPYWKARPWDLNNLARNITKYHKVERDEDEGFIYLTDEGERVSGEEYGEYMRLKGQQ